MKNVENQWKQKIWPTIGRNTRQNEEGYKTKRKETNKLFGGGKEKRERDAK